MPTAVSVSKNLQTLLSRSQLAKAFRVSPSRVTKWAADGMPVADRGSRGRESKYDLAAVVDWHIERRVQAHSGGSAGPIDLAAERAKLARAQTARTLIDIGAKKRDLLPADEVRQVFGGCVHAIRSGLLALPQSLAEQCVVASPQGAVAVEAIIKTHVQDLLRTLSQWPGPLMDANETPAA